eukprot:XP_014018819.1 PREDICTED: single-pass membrane and coiled-coil domain-containing protein 1 isoform X1 [Salmo salar]
MNLSDHVSFSHDDTEDSTMTGRHRLGKPEPHITSFTLGSRLDAVIGRFGELDEAERVLTGMLKNYRQALANQKQQKQVWTSLLEDSLSTVEVSLLLGYVSDTFHSCHTLVLQRVPDLAPSLPTTTSVLRTQPKNRRVDKAGGLL